MYRLVAVRVLGLNILLFRNREKCSVTALAPHSHTQPLCALLHSWGFGGRGSSFVDYGNNALLTGNQRNSCTSWQCPASGSEVGICINGVRKLISCMCEKPDVPSEGKRGALSSKQQLLWHNVRHCWQSRFVLGVQLREFIDGWQEAAPCCSTVSSLT